MAQPVSSSATPGVVMLDLTTVSKEVSTGSSNVLPPVSSVLSPVPLSPALATINEMLVVLPEGSNPAPSSSLNPNTSAVVSENVADELAALGFSAVAAESGEPHAGEADAPTQDKEGLLYFSFS